jgi:hypothetical protein
MQYILIWREIMHPDVPGFKLLDFNDRYATSDDGRIWHKGEMVVRLWCPSVGMVAYTVESVLAGKPKLPSDLFK